MDKTDNAWQRVRLAHDYILNRVNYAPTPGEDHTKNNVYDALLGADRLTKCVGYSQANSLILSAMGFEVSTTGGDAGSDTQNQQAHAWNYVTMDDGKVYAVDVTFDDPLYTQAQRDSLPDEFEQSTEFFLRGSDYMSRTHSPYTTEAAQPANFSTTDYIAGYEQMGTNFATADEASAAMVDFFNKLDITDNVEDVYEFRIGTALTIDQIDALVNNALNQSTFTGNIQWYRAYFGGPVRILVIPA